MNTWIFQGNPLIFKINEYLIEHCEISWSVRQVHFASKIKIGDEVFIWRSEGGKQGISGIIASGVVTEGAKLLEFDATKETYWLEKPIGKELVVKLKLEEVRIEKDFIKKSSVLYNPRLKDLPILKLSNQTNYLLTKSQANELRKLWFNNKNSITKLESFSWEIHNSVIALKAIDRSCLIHNSTGIPIAIRSFFYDSSLQKGEKRTIKLLYRLKEYRAHIEMDGHQRTRMKWTSEFTQLLRNNFPNYYKLILENKKNPDEMPILQFVKTIEENKYTVQFIGFVSLKTIEKDLISEEIEEWNV